MIHLAELIAEHPENDPLRSAVPFEMPPMLDIYEFPRCDDLIRLPYPVCWLEGRAPIIGWSSRLNCELGEMRATMGFFAVQAEEGVFFFGLVRTLQAGWSRVIKIAFQYGDNSWAAENDDGRQITDREANYCNWLGAFLTLLNCKNIPKLRIEPPAKLQRARERRGKPPLYSYWTLKLDLAATRERSELGDTHASPRLHLRRGHIRQYLPDRWCWVSPHVVGNKKLGIVHKDYAMRLPDQPAGE